MEKEFYTVKEVAHILGMGKNKTYLFVSQTDFPKIIIGRKIYIPKKDFENFLRHLLGQHYDIK